MKKQQIKRLIISSVACVAGIGIILEQGVMIHNRNQVIDAMSIQVSEVQAELQKVNNKVEEQKNELEEKIKENKTILEVNKRNNQRISQLQEDITQLKKKKEERSRVQEKARTLITEKKDSPQKQKNIAPLQHTRTIKVEVSGYCSCPICSEGWGNQTADGTGVHWGVIAAPKEIPFGTQMKIEGFGDQVFTVNDRGGYIKKVGDTYRIDVWFPKHGQAEEFGRRWTTATILE